MLVLSRKPGEHIHIGDDIKITIVRIGPNTVRLGIACPKEINIARSEMCETPEQREHRLAMAELKSKPPVNIRNAK